MTKLTEMRVKPIGRLKYVRIDFGTKVLEVYAIDEKGNEGTMLPIADARAVLAKAPDRITAVGVKFEDRIASPLWIEDELARRATVAASEKKPSTTEGKKAAASPEKKAPAETAPTAAELEAAAVAKKTKEIKDAAANL